MSEFKLDEAKRIPAPWPESVHPTYDQACPNCGHAPIRPFMRLQVLKSWSLFEWLRWKLFRGPVPTHGFCIICWECKEIVGHE